jgi:two-component system sensor histidine kinase CiaH
VFHQARLRLVAWNVAILAIILLALGAVVYILFERHLYADVDQVLRNDATAAAYQTVQYTVFSPVNPPVCEVSPIIPLSSYSPADPTQYAVVDCHGQPVMHKAIYPAGLEGALNGRYDLRTIQDSAGNYWRVYSQPIQVVELGHTYTVAALQDWSLVNSQIEALQRLLQVLIGGGLVGLLLAGGAGLFLAERALVPIRRAFNRQRQFIADASHELRTPLTLIRSSAEMVAQSADRLESEDAELLNDIIHEVDRLSRLVTDLLTLARVDADRLELKLDLVDLAALARQTHDDVEPLAREKHLQHTVEVQGSSVVMGDEVRLRQLLLILLDNAIKYTEPGGNIALSVSHEDGHVALTVSDTGIGIPAESLPHIFERFYRVESARTHETGGAGLGLSIADWIVRAHKGSIHVDSEPGKGTRVRVELPAANGNMQGRKSGHVDCTETVCRPGIGGGL